MPEITNVQPSEVIDDVWGNLIRDRTIQRYDDRATRTSEHGSPSNGDFAYLEDEKVVEFYDGAAWVGLVPAGTIVMTGRTAAPSGWLLCQGQEISRTTYATLFSAIGTAYGVGDGSTTFNIPDLRQRFPLGKAASGTGQNLGDTGGSINHTHSVTHDHTNPTTSTTGNHTHTNPSTGSGGSHTHTVGNTSSVGNHTHDYGANTDPNGSHTHGFSTGGSSSNWSVAGGAGAAPTTSHTHSGTTNSGGSHAHYSAGTTLGGGGHSHTNPSTGSGGDHTHTVGVTGTDGNHAHTQGNTGSYAGGTGSANPPYLVVNYKIKF